MERRKYSTMRYTYEIHSGDGTVVERDLSSREEAHTVIQHLADAGANTGAFSIVEVAHYTTTGLGRDPDLH